MCRAKHYAEQLLEIYDKINNDLEYFKYKLHYLQWLQEDLLHIIENKKFNVVQGYKLSKKLQETRNERRDYKIELETMINLKKTFVDKNINYLKNTYDSIKRQDEELLSLRDNRVYKPRVLESMELRVIVPLNRKVI